MKKLLLTLAGAFSALSFGQTYDIVLANGRVMDPESRTDAVRNIGITGGRIQALSQTPLNGRTVLDVRGLVVAPGFIDLHSHGQDDENYKFKAHDGVTTALELEIGVSPVAPFYAERAGKALINFGASSGHVPARMAVMHDSGTFLPRDQAAHRIATDEEKLAIVNAVRMGLDDGAIGIGFGIAYVPTAGREEILRLFQLAADRRVPVFVHMRGSIDADGAIPALQEIIADAAATGAPLHVVHITSVGARKTATCLQLIEGARRHGMDVTTEMYPYTASASRIESAIYDGDWLARTGASYHDLQWVASGERLTAESFARYRKEGGAVIAHTIPEEALRLGLANPMVMFASDGRMVNGQGHPRSAGTFCRVLGLYVREQKAIPLMDALRRMTLMPAQRLEASVPAMRNKGRIRVGADADITVFDPDHVIDRATFEKPAQYSDGIRYVLVGGTFVIRDGKTVEGVYPGAGLRTR
ncbi:MAG TPA: amidohydrolase family protein [Bryobacteraceae bacterium]|nr:amidohydrolase family protein [Bryobacteraceae bacterium]